MTAESHSNMEHIDYEKRNLPLSYVMSSDGTRIAFEKSGNGPAVVIISGGLSEKAMHAELAELLSHGFTVYNYDRRGRGGSTDLRQGPYDVALEIADLNAVIDAAGEPCHVFANCTGAMIAIPAAEAGAQMASLAVYEPPYEGPKPPRTFPDEIAALLAQERRAEAVSMWLETDALFTKDEVDFFKNHPIWPAFEEIAHTMLYDTELSAKATELPIEALERIEIPFLALAGEDTMGWMLETCRALAAYAPRGQFKALTSSGHLMDDVQGAKILASFFRRTAPSP